MPINWQPFKEFKEPERPDYFPGMPGEGGWSPFMPSVYQEEPAVDIYQDKNNLYIEVSLGGMKPENVEVAIEDNILVIQGKTEVEKETKQKDYLRKEIKKGSFHRIIKLPIDVRGNKAVAESFEGVLKITVPKIAKTISGAKKVPIKIK